MFQAEPILWLQSYASMPLTAFMWFVSLFGYMPSYIVLVFVLAFGVKLRPTLGVVLALLLAAMATDGLKNGFGLPRPNDVDARVLEPWDGPPQPVAARGAGRTFWSLPAPEAIEAVRAKADVNYGFPSGHESSAVAFLLSAAVFYRSRRLAIAAPFWALLMALSRMYLGRHFLADVLGGAAVGALAVVVAVLLMPRGEQTARVEHPLPRYVPLLAAGAVLFVLTAFVPLYAPDNAGQLAGFAAACTVLAARGFPLDGGTAAQRCVRVVLAVLFYAGIYFGLVAAFDATGWDNRRLASGVAAGLATVGAFVGVVELSRRLRWYGVAEAARVP